MSYQFPTDERFRKIAAKIADAVMVAELTGFATVSASNKVWLYCPMGCVETSEFRPTSRPRVIRNLGMTALEFCDFTSAFDDGIGLKTPFAELGRAYRKRFP
jgi:hypothetical protein